jgi:hypothetical protein
MECSRFREAAMMQAALLQAPVVLGPAVAGRPLAGRPAWKLPEPVKRLLRRVHAWTGDGYRPERHYMRGGRTPGAKSLAVG